MHRGRCSSVRASPAGVACRRMRSSVGSCGRDFARYTMKVGVYNQFLTTMGGGERHMGTAAEVLARAGHDVEVITHVPASIEKLATRFELDLTGVRLLTTPLLPFDQLGDLSAEYDLWVNGSHMSVVP